jgi:hypothetical protein
MRWLCSRKKAEKSDASFASYLPHTCFLFGLFFETEDGGDMLLRNFGGLPTHYMALYPKRQNCSQISLLPPLQNAHNNQLSLTPPLFTGRQAIRIKASAIN